MDGRVVYTTGVPYGDGQGGGMAVQADYQQQQHHKDGEVELEAAEVILESVQVWALDSCWINETTALQMLR
jgi:hypothetical protein